MIGVTDPRATVAEVDALRHMCDHFGLGDADRVTFAARGSMGRVYRVDSGGRAYALKMFYDHPDPDRVAAEVAFTELAMARGLAAPQSIAARNGGFVVPSALPGVAYGRLYTWADGSQISSAARHLSDAAEILAVLHGTDHRTDRAIDPWYEITPSADEWDSLLARLAAVRSRWAEPLRVRRADLVEFSGWVVPTAAPAGYSCHLDVKPANILITASGRRTLVDWDNAGPADRDRELVCTMLNWTGTDPGVAAGAISTFMRRYREAGGQARPQGLPALSMYLATTINYLYVLALAALDGANRLDPAEIPRFLHGLPDASTLMGLSAEWERY
ncbi:aminoglycoside phosphotransferase [Micromonospora sp. L5]|uniref:phosphotransferase n=1 Tax=Micromonospora sp. (strain L5) TaxID=648999 RepID=UPI0001C45C87|nr:phosphotransferase [Micromonospora sp. L5]ADU06399.1 aminoglycoside phosphotransferase [Micromonospora sp. L5]